MNDDWVSPLRYVETHDGSKVREDKLVSKNGEQRKYGKEKEERPGKRPKTRSKRFCADGWKQKGGEKSLQPIAISSFEPLSSTSRIFVLAVVHGLLRRCELEPDPPGQFDGFW